MPVEPRPDDIRLRTWPDPVLREVALPVPEVTASIRRLAEQMLTIMHDAPGVGLAAPQVGVSLRLFVANATGEPEQDEVYINPVLEALADAPLEPFEEGCLSLPDIRGEITRPAAIRICYTTLAGEQVCREADGLLARIWQHETDHLDGRLILDRMPRIDRLAARRRLRELEEGYEGRR